MKISNKQLTASFKTKGAELISLKKRDDQTEYIWQADPAHWGRHAPILFPFVGKLKNNRFYHAGKSYEMGQHGFARDMEFEISDHTGDELIFELSSNEQTRQHYPFDFELTIAYQLTGNKLNISYKVSNKGDDEMYFSIGGHPAFNCPMSPEEKRADYWLEFVQPQTLESHLLEGGLFSGATKTVPTKDGILPVSDTLFDDDALVFKNLSSQSVALCSKSKKWLTFHYEGFPYLGIWSKSGQSPFVCIEPWHGLADHVNHNGHLSEKEGIRKLKPSQVFKTSYSVELH